VTRCRRNFTPLCASVHHLPGTPCSGCIHPYSDDGGGNIPTISIISAWAGVELALELLRDASGHRHARAYSSFPLAVNGTHARTVHEPLASQRCARSCPCHSPRKPVLRSPFTRGATARAFSLLTLSETMKKPSDDFTELSVRKVSHQGRSTDPRGHHSNGALRAGVRYQAGRTRMSPTRVGLARRR
jgi:hypothetical protein